MLGKVNSFITGSIRSSRTEQFIQESKPLLIQGRIPELETLIEKAKRQKQDPKFEDYLNQLERIQDSKRLESSFRFMKPEYLQILKEGNIDLFIKTINKEYSYFKDDDLNSYFTEKLSNSTELLEKVLIELELERVKKEESIRRGQEKAKKEQLVKDTIGELIEKYAYPYNTLDFNKGLAVPYADIYIDYSASQQERAASLLKAYKEYAPSGIKIINLVPCESENCYAAHKNFTDGVLGYAEIMDDWIRIHASNAQVRKVDQLLLTVKGALMASDPYWYEYEDQGIEHQVIYDNALAINYHLVSTISPWYVKTNPLIRGDRLETFFEINNGEITINKFPK